MHLTCCSFAAADMAVEVLVHLQCTINLEEIEATDNQKKAHGIDVKQKIFATVRQLGNQSR